jgi:hypothetical protein
MAVAHVSSDTLTGIRYTTLPDGTAHLAHTSDTRVTVPRRPRPISRARVSHL